jgi:hypothetical protein
MKKLNQLTKTTSILLGVSVGLAIISAVVIPTTLTRCKPKTPSPPPEEEKDVPETVEFYKYDSDGSVLG